MKKAILLILMAVSVLTACGGKEPEPTQSDRGETSTKQWDKPPAMTIDHNKNWQATVQTNMGDIQIELFAKEAPKTVNNFVFLAKEDFYNNVLFHRVIKDFMIQTGDPTGTGAGGPGYAFEDELPSPHSYQKGIVAMANAGPNTNGSQFFICNGPGCENLNSMPNYTIFGQVIGGMDVVEKISNVNVKQSPMGEPSQPTEEMYIKQVIIEEK